MKKYFQIISVLGIGDIWFRIIGIAILGFIIPMVYFGESLNNGLIAYLPSWSFSILFCLIIWEVNRGIFIYFHLKLPKSSDTKRRLILQSLVMIIVTIVIADVLDYFLNPLAGEMGIKHSSIQKYAASLTSLISVVGMYEIFYLFRQLNKSELQKEQLKRENVSSQLESLKNQVNPHFLFNSLNTLATIITEDEKLAVKFVENMSKVYRSILEMKDRTIVSLEEEWAFTQNYIFLLKTRFEDALEFQVNLEAKTENYAIVPISLQLLIENAIKHNIVSRSQKLIIQLDIDNDYLVVSNKLQPRTEVINSTNTGLKNINNRVKLVTNKEIVIIQTETEFKVRIPLMNIQSYESTDH